MAELGCTAEYLSQLPEWVSEPSFPCTVHTRA